MFTSLYDRLGIVFFSSIHAVIVSLVKVLITAFVFLVLFIPLNVFGNSTTSTFCFAIFATTAFTVNTVFFLLVVFNVLGYLTTGTFGTVVTLVGGFFVHLHFVTLLILHVVVHSSHHAFNLGQLGLHPFWQVIIVTKDLF